MEKNCLPMNLAKTNIPKVEALPHTAYEIAIPAVERSSRGRRP